MVVALNTTAVTLERFGFTPTETKVYESLLRLGPSTGYAVAKDVRLARANVYQALDGLVREKEPRYRRLWETRLSAQVAMLPDFEQVFRAVRRALRQVGVT